MSIQFTVGDARERVRFDSIHKLIQWRKNREAKRNNPSHLRIPFSFLGWRGFPQLAAMQRWSSHRIWTWDGNHSSEESQSSGGDRTNEWGLMELEGLATATTAPGKPNNISNGEERGGGRAMRWMVSFSSRCRADSHQLPQCRRYVEKKKKADKRISDVIGPTEWWGHLGDEVKRSKRELYSHWFKGLLFPFVYPASSQIS